MNSFHAVLKYHSRNNCFGYIETFTDVQHTPTIQASGTSSSVYSVISREKRNLSAPVQVFVPNSCHIGAVRILLINKTFGELLHFCKYEEVILEELKDVPACSAFEVELKSAEDWDILQNSTQRIEEVLLEQLQVVTVGQTYPVWVAENVIIYFIVVEIEVHSSHEQTAYLNEDTEMHVRAFSSVANFPKNDLKEFPTSFTHIMRDICSNATAVTFTSRIQDYCGDGNTRILARILPEVLQERCMEHGDNLVLYMLKSSQSTSASITISSVSNHETGNSTYALLVEISERCIHFTKIKKYLRQYNMRHCIPSLALRRIVGSSCEWIEISPVPKDQICQIEILEVLSEKELSEQFGNCLKSHLWQTWMQYPVIVPAEGLDIEVESFYGKNAESTQCRIRPREAAVMKESGTSLKCFVFTNDMFPVLEYSVMKGNTCASNHERNAKQICNRSESFGEWNVGFMDFAFQTTIVEKCCEYIIYQLEKTIISFTENILITGDKSASKTTILYILAQKLLHSRWVVYSEYLCCTEWKGKSPKNIEKLLAEVVMRLKKRFPSVLLLDNLDFFPRSPDEDQRNINLEAVAESIRRLTEQNEILVVATTCSKREIVKLFPPNTSKRFFGHMEFIKKLSLADREECLEGFCKQETEVCSLRSAAQSTEKCTIGDLKRLALRIILESKAKGHQKVEEDDVHDALIGFRPNGVQLGLSSMLADDNLKWEDVGGLEDVKQILIEVFIWPVKYPMLYCDNFIRRGRGVLLYGPSGCGKTFIGKVLAAQCNFNVIFIKGPELLSKYIGQSEENVRQTFERARASSPCLIFFDEFDSLGPKRGHDDTGVTDRVVNQLLTELDGVEGLEDVYVLAATNRIDLIDSALLRPGRFDYIVKCGLPTKEDRKSLLGVLCRDISLSEDVDLEGIALETVGWTGADLRGLITNAQLMAYKRMKGELNEKCADLDKKAKYFLSQSDLLSALKESEPRRTRSFGTGKKRHIPVGMLTSLA